MGTAERMEPHTSAAVATNLVARPIRCNVIHFPGLRPWLGPGPLAWLWRDTRGPVPVAVCYSHWLSFEAEFEPSGFLKLTILQLPERL